MMMHDQKRRLTDEEQQVLDDVEAGAYEDVTTSETLNQARDAAKNYFRKDSRVNVRLNHQDVERLKRIAAREGLPYQTLIASVLHKYAVKNLDIDVNDL